MQAELNQITPHPTQDVPQVELSEQDLEVVSSGKNGGNVTGGFPPGLGFNVGSPWSFAGMGGGWGTGFGWGGGQGWAGWGDGGWGGWRPAIRGPLGGGVYARW